MALNTEAFSAAERETLRALVALFGREVLLVGGAALRAHYGLRWRTTDDVDVYVAARGAEAMAKLRRASWEPTPDRLLGHRWRSPTGCTVDVIPAGMPPGEQSTQTTGPGSAPLNVLGSAAAFRDRRDLEIGRDSSIGVAGAAGLFVLKASAYLDAPTVRPHDLQDIAWLLASHADDDDRRFGDDVLDSGLAHEDAGGFVLGRDVRSVSDAVESLRIAEWCSFVEEPGRHRLSIMGSNAPGLRLGDDAAAWARDKLAAFRRGFDFTA